MKGCVFAQRFFEELCYYGVMQNDATATKLCGGCGQPKPLTEQFWYRTGGAWKTPCKACRLQIAKKKRESDPDFRQKEMERSRQWHAENPEQAVEVKRAWYDTHLEEERERGRIRSKEWYENNKERKILAVETRRKKIRDIEAPQRLAERERKKEEKRTRQLKVCVRCGESKPIHQFRVNHILVDGRWGTCRECENDEWNIRRDELRKTPEGQRQIRAEGLRHWHGITLEQYDQLMEDAGSACQACGATEDLHVDHDHVVEKIRGILCGNCNRALGFIKDDPERLRQLIKYIETFTPEKLETCIPWRGKKITKKQ